MTGKTHVAMGMAAGLTIGFGQPFKNQLALVLASAIGSLIPDLDHPKGRLNQKLLFINNNFYRAIFYLSLAGIFMYIHIVKKNDIFLFLGMISSLIGISSHRSFTHSIIGFLTATSIVGLGTLDYQLYSIHSGFLIGYVLHLVADFFTAKGIKLFYPINTNVSFPITIKTNGRAEKIIFRLLSIYSICLLLRYINI